MTAVRVRSSSRRHGLTRVHVLGRPSGSDRTGSRCRADPGFVPDAGGDPNSSAVRPSATGPEAPGRRSGAASTTTIVRGRPTALGGLLTSGAARPFGFWAWSSHEPAELCDEKGRPAERSAPVAARLAEIGAVRADRRVLHLHERMGGLGNPAQLNSLQSLQPGPPIPSVPPETIPVCRRTRSRWRAGPCRTGSGCCGWPRAVRRRRSSGSPGWASVSR